MTWNTSTNEMTVNVSFSGLTTPTMASHIHCRATLPTSAMVATTTPTFPGFPLRVMAGTYSHTFDMTNPTSYNPMFLTAHGGTTASAAAALLAGLQGGQAYLNIHTAMFTAARSAAACSSPDPLGPCRRRPPIRHHREDIPVPAPRPAPGASAR